MHDEECNKSGISYLKKTAGCRTFQLHLSIRIMSVLLVIILLYIMSWNNMIIDADYTGSKEYTGGIYILK